MSFNFLKKQKKIKIGTEKKQTGSETKRFQRTRNYMKNLANIPRNQEG